MSDILTIMQKQLAVEVKSAEQKLTASNLDAIYKLTSSIINMQRMNVGTPEESKNVPEYSNGMFEKNIDLLYDKYMTAKSQYRKNGSQVYKDALIDSVRRLMSEVYDMLVSMMKDCECEEEKREIQVNVKRLNEM